MELLSDTVPNVRLAALGLLPALKQTIRLPEDVQQLVSPKSFSLTGRLLCTARQLTSVYKYHSSLPDAVAC